MIFLKIYSILLVWVSSLFSVPIICFHSLLIVYQISEFFIPGVILDLRFSLLGLSIYFILSSMPVILTFVACILLGRLGSDVPDCVCKISFPYLYFWVPFIDSISAFMSSTVFFHFLLFYLHFHIFL